MTDSRLKDGDLVAKALDSGWPFTAQVVDFRVRVEGGKNIGALSRVHDSRDK